MIGWSRRSSEDRRRRAQWFESLSPEEKDLERRYQHMVNRKFFPLFGLFALISIGMVWTLGPLMQKHPSVLFLLVASSPLLWAGPFLFIPTSRKWKAYARSQRQDT